MAKKAITLQTKILHNDIINVEMEEDINNLVSNEESSVVSTKSQKTANSGKISTGSGRGKTLNLRNLKNKLNSNKKNLDKWKTKRQKGKRKTKSRPTTKQLMINWIDYGIQRIRDTYVIRKERIEYYYLSQKNLVLTG